MLQHMSSLSHNINIAERFTINNFSNYCSELKVKKKIYKNLPHDNFLQSLSTHSKRRTKRKNPLKSPLIMK